MSCPRDDYRCKWELCNFCEDYSCRYHFVHMVFMDLLQTTQELHAISECSIEAQRRLQNVTTMVEYTQCKAIMKLRQVFKLPDYQVDNIYRRALIKLDNIYHNYGIFRF